MSKAGTWELAPTLLSSLALVALMGVVVHEQMGSLEGPDAPAVRIGGAELVPAMKTVPKPSRATAPSDADEPVEKAPENKPAGESDGEEAPTKRVRSAFTMPA